MPYHFISESGEAPHCSI